MAKITLPKKSAQANRAKTRPGEPAKTPPALEPDFLTVGQVARLIQCSVRKIQRLIKSEELVATRFGRSIRIHVDDYNVFCARQRKVR